MSLPELSKLLNEMSESAKLAQTEYELANDNWWNQLSEQQREHAFYAVVKRIQQAELVEQRSFRGTLYGVFGFDIGMYGRAIDCGYMNIHNAMFDGNEFMDMSCATTVEVIDNNNSVVWNEVNGVAITTNNGCVSLELNKGNPYV